jgi:hypothetical protein
MKLAGLSVAIALLVLTPAAAEDVPFAEPPPPEFARSETAMVPVLADIMTIIQLHHIKLWYAAQAGNWKLAAHELDRTMEGLGRAASLYRNIPIDYITAMNKPIADMRASILAKDAKGFGGGYRAFSEACNGCHAGGGLGFIRIQVPTSSPFTDEIFESQP